MKKATILVVLAIMLFSTVFTVQNGIAYASDSGSVLGQSANSLRELIEQFEKEGQLTNKSAAHALKLHLTAVSQYEKKEEIEKVVKHMENFKLLLSNQWGKGLISEEIYQTLTIGATLLIEKYQENENEDSLNINPTPQEMSKLGKGFPLSSVVGLVIGENTDEAAIREVEKLLIEAGVKEIVRKNSGEGAPNTPVTIWIGGPSENEDSIDVLQQLGVEGPEGLKAEGYVLVSSQKKIVLAGKDKAGTFYAAQTFGQMIQERQGQAWIPSIAVQDWPEMPLRGSIEGFYGPQWTHEDRLSQLMFYGDNKMNAYIYAPKDDPYHREQWRVPYPDKELTRIKELMDTSKENHVNFTFSLSPGNSVCYSGDEDFELLMNKMDKIWDNGGRSYAIFLDDISYSLHCQQDVEKFGSDSSPTAAAQAYLLNRFNEEFIQTHQGAERLITVPTDYAGNQTNAYRKRFADLVDEDTLVMWTGKDVVTDKITSEEAKLVSTIFKHDLYIWDNYPTNDFDRNRLFLGAFVNRDADLTENGVVGIAANPMNEAEASKIPLYTIADYTWNPYAYNPEESWERSIKSFGGDEADSLRTFAENSYSSLLSDKESLTLTPLLDQFSKAYAEGDAEQAAKNLIAEFENLQQASASLRENMDNEKFLKEIDRYLVKLSLSGKAGVTAVNLMMAQKVEDSEVETQLKAELLSLMQQLDRIPQEVGKFVIKPLLIQAIYGEGVLSRPLNGVNRGRNQDDLIQYTPLYGDSTRTNMYGYEVTVVDGLVVKRGGYNSKIPTDGYVLSIHNSDWLLDNAVLGASVEIADGQVLIRKPK
ncbi:beta-N-acetylglucosaminidase domain-containing protein [Sporosarcina sp. NPDC096371]|uniref:beta-N-acetylglucosaminidase domain-containing protein n=1 Tax=Sporosarcina sp. NPDC096371 TaxID=3364530 RepID=UPI00380C5AB7